MSGRDYDDDERYAEETRFPAEYGPDPLDAIDDLARWNVEKREEEAIKRREVKERHRDFLDKRGLPYEGVSPATGPKVRRITHCFECKKKVDSAINLECNTCKWILCACGACGCTYKWLK